MTERGRNTGGTPPINQKGNSSISRFYADLFPEKGFIEIRCLKNEKVERQWFETSDTAGLINFTTRKTEEGFNCYFGVASRKKGGGTKNDLDYVRAVWVDIDCKDESEKSTVLEKLLNDSFIPSYVIDSGHGFHVYWILKEPVKDFALIERINIGLASYFNGDKQAHDSARILRCPGTKNYKDQPLEVKIIFHNDIEFDLLSLQERFETDTEIYETGFKKIDEQYIDSQLIDGVIKSCAFLTHCKVQSKTLSEPEWYVMITNLTALGAYEKIHELSKDYNNPPNVYTKEETDKKIEHAKKDAPGPHTCQYIQKVLGFNCGDCTWKDKVKAPAGIAFKLQKKNPKLPFEILGHNKNLDTILYYNGEIVKLSIQQLNKKALQYLGVVAEDYSEVVADVMKTAREKGFVDTESPAYKEMGIWKVNEGFLIINGRGSYIYDGKIHKLDVPKINGQLIELNGTPWLDMDRLEQELKEASLYETFLELYDLVTQWEFDDSDGDMARYFTAFVMLAPLQQAMEWRPWLYITGMRGVGKTTLFDEVLGIYGELTVRLDKATAHAIVQEIGSTGKILILDEFELKNPKGDQNKITDILELLKTTSKGGVYKRGTTAEKARGWMLNHLVWLGSIYPQLDDSAQRSRTILFELKPPKKGRLKTLTQAEKRSLAHKIVACMLRHWIDIEKHAQANKNWKEEFKDGRMIDNISYASALLELINPDWAGVPSFVLDTNWDEDEKELMTAILNSRVEEDRILSQLLAREEDCEDKGVKWVRHNGEMYLTIDPALVGRYLLKDTKWAGKTHDIDTMLKRISSEKQKFPVRMNGSLKKLYLIDKRTIAKYGLVLDGEETTSED